MFLSLRSYSDSHLEGTPLGLGQARPKPFRPHYKREML